MDKEEIDENEMENEKLEWVTPELEVIDLPQETMAGNAGNTDSGVLS